MKKRFLFLIALASGLAASRATAQTTPPVLIVNIVEVQVTNDTVGSIKITSTGSNYEGFPPTVTLVPQTGGGANAMATATLDSGMGGPGTGNAVLFATVTAPGTGYIGPPTVTFSGGGSTAMGATPPTEATGISYLTIATDFLTPNQNEAHGPAGDTIGINALASGTQPESGFIYSFTVDGQPIGATAPTTPGEPNGVYWTPPLPGVYSIVVSTSDGTNMATSPAIRYFATGTVIVSPEAGGSLSGPGTLVPVGSVTVLQATATSADGFISKILFYTDWNGTTGTLIGTATNYPYSVQYTPTGAPGATHLIKAIAYDNNGVIVPPAVVPTNPNQDEILLTMATPNPGGLPTAQIITPATGALVEIPNYISDPTASVPVDVVAGATDPGATITKVELYVNGVLYATDTQVPYNFTWTPKVTGAFALLALAYDTNGNVVASTDFTTTSTSPVPGPATVTIESAPAIAITTPGGGATLNSGSAATIQAIALDTNLDQNGNPIPVTQVQFFQDGNFVGSANTPVSGDSYQISFKPVQKTEDGVVVQSVLTAIVSDAQGFQGTSAGISVNVTSGGTGSNNVVIGTPPTVLLVTPVNNANVIVNTPVTLSASGTAPNGNIASVAFLVDNAVVQTVTQYPYSYSYTFQNLGTYQVSVQVVDNLGDKTISSPPATVIVVPEPPPTVSVTTPVTGVTVTTGAAVTVTANATSPSGTITSVQFFENGLPIGTATTAPYTETFTPLSAGVYTFTAIATDNAGETTTTIPVVVEAFPAAGGLGTTTYFGQYQSLTDGGRFAFIVVDGTLGTFIGYSTSGKAVNSFYTDIPVGPGGSFSAPGLTGTVSQTGVSGTLSPSQDLFIGSATQSGSVAVASGYYTGSIVGVAGSELTGILGADGEFMVYISSGSFNDVGYGSVDSTGAFTITTVGNNSLTGKVDPSTGFLTGTLSGASGGPLLGARVSGGTFSDGVLKNISTRGQVGSGANVMIAGFVVGGSAPKQLLIRAVGPTLATFSLPGSVSATQLQVFSGATLVSSNTGWSSTAANTLAVNNADSQVGAFALPAGSGDSALVGSFPPGNYTAMVSGAGGATGIGLVEVYDLNSYVPFTTQKLTNVSTRAVVGTGNDVLVGGFIINGTAPKRLLIRAAGPSLTALNVSGALATPHLQLFNSSEATIRENFSWQTGNDPGMVSAAEEQTGAFAFGKGSADSVILIVLPPGTYTAEVSGVGQTTGTALVEVYEVP